ncbi:MAG: hypothetical protein EOO01_23525 [Chitinophagaceae bacterium]|nr:MAG: hypothetical protein EOO01_23525 [Chitinophagaceae bacterium]
MKKLLLFVMFAWAGSYSQVSVNVNIGAPPVWAPPTPVGVDYYFLPEINSYYDIRSTEYIYVNRGNWIRSRQLPVVYRNYDLQHGRTVFVNDYHGRTPYKHYKVHKVKYKHQPKKHYGHKNGHHKHGR